MNEASDSTVISSNKSRLTGYIRPNFRYTPKSLKKSRSKCARSFYQQRIKPNISFTINESEIKNSPKEIVNFSATNELDNSQMINTTDENPNESLVDNHDIENEFSTNSLKQGTQIEANNSSPQHVDDNDFETLSDHQTPTLKSNNNCQTLTPINQHSNQYASPLPQFDNYQKVPNSVAKTRQTDGNYLNDCSPNQSPNMKSPIKRITIHIPKQSINQRALKHLGFSPEDLEYPTESTISLYSKNPLLKQYVRDELYKDVADRIALYNQEIERLLGENDQDEDIEISISSKNQLSFESRLELHEQQMKRLFIKQKKALILKIYQALSYKYRQQETQRRNELHKTRIQEREQKLLEKHRIEEEIAINRREFIKERENLRQEQLKEYQQKEITREEKFKIMKEEEKKTRAQKKIEFENKMHERLENHIEIQRQKEETNRKKFNIKMQRIEEREEKLKQQKLQAQKDFKKKIEANLNEHTQLINGIEEEKRKKIDTLRKKLDESEMQLQKTLKELHDQKAQTLEDRKNKNEERSKRAQIRKELIEKERILDSDKEIYKRRQKIAEAKMQEIEERRAQKRIQSLENEKLIKERLEYLEDEKEKRRDIMRKEYYEKDKIIAEKILAQKQKDDEDREFAILQEKISMSRRQFSLLVRDRQKQYRNEEIQKATKLRMEALKAEEAKQKEQTLQLLQKTDLAIAENEYLIRQFDNEISTAKTERQLRLLAEQFGIDFDSIDEKAKNPRSRQSIADIINEECA